MESELRDVLHVLTNHSDAIVFHFLIIPCGSTTEVEPETCFPEYPLSIPLRATDPIFKLYLAGEQRSNLG